MTGRELIMYILQNNLEDKQIFEDGKFIGFMSETEAAIKFDVGVSTVRAWAGLGVLESITINDMIYIPLDAQKPTFVYVYSERG